MASPTIDLLISKLVSILENEASLLGGIGDEIYKIKMELISMRSFLEDADRKGALTRGEKTWVANVRNVAYDVEDIIDNFMYYKNRQRNLGKYTRLFHQTINIPKNVFVRHQIAARLKKANSMIRMILETTKRYGVDHLEGITLHYDCRWMKNHGESCLFVKDENLVGVEKAKCQLFGWLLSGELQRTVISVFGLGGLGKTTLVASTYNSQVIKQHFDCCAWITVSQNYVIEDIFRVMIGELYKGVKEEVPMNLSIMSYRQLVEMLVDFLHARRYVIVLDDVWSVDLCDEIYVALPDRMNGSRVLLTSRKEDVASFSFGSRSHVHQLLPLEKDEAWALFCMKTFSNNSDGCCPRELEYIGRNLVEKCNGLPLAIVALAGLMSTKKLEFEWRKVHNRLNAELSSNPKLEVVKSVLMLSFNDLPYQLKNCFLYCSVFPEDHMIRRKRLIRLWIAEGFVRPIRGATLEEVAENYLMELICRSMLQLVERNPSGRPKACRMHDLMRELAISLSESENFCDIYDVKEVIRESGARRLSIHVKDQEIQFDRGISHIRSLLVFPVDKASKSLLSGVFRGLKLLRVLDLENLQIKKLPNSLIDLFNLRYLNLTGTQVEQLPKSIENLCNLETLDIKESKIEELPIGIAKLQYLRHLIAYRHNLVSSGTDFNYAFGTRAPSDICKLKNLQVLAGVEGHGNLIKRLRNLIQLRRLILTKLRQVDEEDLCIAIDNMKLLHHLFLKATNEEEPLPINALSSSPCLEKLKLVGKMDKVPCWFPSLHSLTFLLLSWSRLREDPLPYLQALPNLARLILVNAYVGKRLCFLEGFQKLKMLSIHRCHQLTDIAIEKGVMPGLQSLSLGRCMELKALPGGIEHLTSLQELTLIIVREDIITCIHGEGSVDRQKVQHIPKISHYYQTQSGISYERIW